MAIIFNKKDYGIHWDDPQMFLTVEESYWQLKEYLCRRKLDGHDEDVQWYMAVHNKMDELLELYSKNPRKEDLVNDQEIM